MNQDDLNDRSLYFFEYPPEAKNQQFCLVDLQEQDMEKENQEIEPIKTV